MHLLKNIVYLFFSYLLLVGFGDAVQAQTITISPPAIQFTQACASSSFNTYNFSFSFFPVQNLGAGNQFIVELSDSAGNFTSPTVVKVLTNTTSPVSSNFNLPTNTYGEGYKLRVRSTNPVRVSSPSLSFAAYYAIHNQPFPINGNNGTVNICEGEEYVLQIDNNGTPSSPLYYPSLTYIWYKDFVEIPGETGPSLTVTEEGSYYVTVDYGSCVLNSYSNIVQVNVQETLAPSIEAEDNNTALCPGETRLLTSSIQAAGLTYTWYRDEVAIAGANQPEYEASEEGVYHMAVSNGDCVFESNAILLEFSDFELSIDPASETTIIPGETLTLTAITDAENPSYQWYRNNTLITGATGSTLQVTQQGAYKAEVSQAAPCAITKEASVVVIYPQSFNLAIAPAAAYEACSSNAVNLAVAQFDAVTNEGVVNIIDNNYGYFYQWFKDGEAVAGETGMQLQLDDALQNGTYTLQATIPDYGVVTSNPFTVNLSVGPVAIAGETVLCEGSQVELTATITNAAYAYQWYNEGVAIAGATTQAFSADAEGSYYVTVTSGGCTSQSDVIDIETAEITISSSSPATGIIIPEQEVVLSVTTDAQAPAFAWYRNGIQLSETTATYTATQAGTYSVEVIQTEGCNVTASMEFVLEYPASFTITIGADTAYEPCTSTSATLTVTGFTAETPSGTITIDGEGYQYQWYRNGQPVAGTNEDQILLDNAQQNGDYNLIVTLPDYGDVTSNTIPVDIAIASQDVAILGEDVLCEGGQVVLSATEQNNAYAYQWYKDEAAIAGATSPTYNADADGAYYLTATSGNCTAQSNTITVETAQITVASASPSTNVIIPGQQVELAVTTDAQAPAFTWYRNGSQLAETTAALTATQDGTYKVVVTQTQGCNAMAEMEFVLQYPSSFELVIAADTYEECVTESTTLSVTGFTAENPSDSVVVADNSSYAYQWYRNGQPVAGATSATVAVTGAEMNGEYTLTIILPGYGAVTSNPLPVNLAPADVVIINDTALCEGGQVLLTASQSGNAYAFQWYKDGAAIAGANAPVFAATEEGYYYLVISSGSCTKQSNTISLNIAQISVSSPSPATDVIIPGQQKELTVATDAQAPEFTWYRNGSQLAETTATLTATQNGTYKVVVVQTQGCNATAEMEFVLEYPSSFTITIAADPAYEACVSGSAALSVTSFTAQTPSGTVAVEDMAYQYQWFRNNEAVAGASSNVLTISGAEQSGQYALTVTLPGYGEVTSNAIAILLAPADVTITNNTSLCEGGEVVLTADVTGNVYTYQWYKDGAAINGANEPALTVGSEGEYYLIIANGACTRQSNTIELETDQIAVSSTSPAIGVILPGQEVDLTITTDAQSPQYTWYRNNILLTETSAVLSATEDGEYRVVVTQTEGCNATAERTFILQFPAGFVITIGTEPGYQACTSESAVLHVAEFTALTPSGNINVVNMGYQYQWFLNDEPVAGANAAAFIATESGSYKIGAAIPGFDTVYSNAIIVNLSVGDIVISNNGVLCEGGEVQLISNINNPNYTYQWFNNNEAIAGANAPVFNATEEGAYHLVVTSGICTSQSNIINLQPAQITVTATAPVNDVILPGQEKTLSVTTDAQSPVFSWYRNNELLAETSSSVTVTQDGEYRVVVTQTEGCNATAEQIFMLQYPAGFNLTISADAGYIACESESVTLSVAQFFANAPSGNIDVTAMGYQYQWYKDEVPVTGATAENLTVTGADQNGTYTLVALVPVFGDIASNSITVNLGIGQVEITASGVLCPENPNVELSSNITDSAYTYTWLLNDAEVSSGNSPVYSATAEGAYKLVIETGTCSFTSNTLALEENSFIISSGNPDSDILIPGETKVISVTTDAVQPAYQWFRNNVLIPGATSNTITVTTDGSYRVVVTQTEGCTLVMDRTFILAYPSQYQVSIAANAAYEECTSTSAMLNIVSFTAVTPPGLVDISETAIGYQYQWFRNGELIPGATVATLIVNESGNYYLEVVMTPTQTVVSNTVAINLAFVNGVTIATDDIFCADGAEVTITSNVTDPAYTYTWYSEDHEVVGTEPSVTVYESGSYYLEVSYQGCTLTSTVLELVPYDLDQVVVDAGSEVDLPEGTSTTVTASGAESYEWYYNNDLISNEPSIEITKPGTYTLIATVGECEIIKEVVVKPVENNIVAIPNVVTPNNDGINDKWSLPLQYVNKGDVEIVIYGPDGSIVFRGSNYMNNWPESDFTYSRKNPVYYYTIMEKNEITRRGSITIVK